VGVSNGEERIVGISIQVVDSHLNGANRSNGIVNNQNHRIGAHALKNSFPPRPTAYISLDGYRKTCFVVLDRSATLERLAGFRA
jgi:hypothetical protein